MVLCEGLPRVSELSFRRYHSTPRKDKTGILPIARNHSLSSYRRKRRILTSDESAVTGCNQPCIGFHADCIAVLGFGKYQEQEQFVECMSVTNAATDSVVYEYINENYFYHC